MSHTECLPLSRQWSVSFITISGTEEATLLCGLLLLSVYHLWTGYAEVVLFQRQSYEHLYVAGTVGRVLITEMSVSLYMYAYPDHVRQQPFYSMRINWLRASGSGYETRLGLCVVWNAEFALFVLNLRNTCKPPTGSAVSAWRLVSSTCQPSPSVKRSPGYQVWVHFLLLSHAMCAGIRCGCQVHTGVSPYRPILHCSLPPGGRRRVSALRRHTDINTHQTAMNHSQQCFPLVNCLLFVFAQDCNERCYYLFTNNHDGNKSKTYACIYQELIYSS